MDVTLREELLTRLREGSLDLPLLPGSACELMELTARDDTDPRQLAAVVRRDTGLTAHFLRLANSPLYRARGAIVSLPQAVSRLGFDQVRQIAMTVACHEHVFRAQGHEVEARASFRHSFAAALFAQEIARQRRGNVEEAFLAALLHDAGAPALLQAIAEVPRQAGETTPEEQARVVVELHAAVGAALAQKWELPPRIVDAIAAHDAHTSSTLPELALLTSLADQLAHFALEHDPSPSVERAAFTHGALAPLNIYPDDLAALLAQSGHLRETVQTLS